MLTEKKAEMVDDAETCHLKSQQQQSQNNETNWYLLSLFCMEKLRVGA